MLCSGQEDERSVMEQEQTYGRVRWNRESNVNRLRMHYLGLTKVPNSLSSVWILFGIWQSASTSQHSIWWNSKEKYSTLKIEGLHCLTSSLYGTLTSQVIVNVSQTARSWWWACQWIWKDLELSFQKIQTFGRKAGSSWPYKKPSVSNVFRVMPNSMTF